MPKQRTYYKEEQRKIRRMVLHESLFSEYMRGNSYEACWHRVDYSPVAPPHLRHKHFRRIKERRIRERAPFASI